MARVNKEAVKAQCREHFPAFLRSRANGLMLNAWMTGRQYETEDWEGNAIGKPFAPHEGGDEHEDLAKRTPVPWGGLIVTSLAQTAYVDGIRAPEANENLQTWQTMERNSWARRQIGIHRAAIGHGEAYGVVLPGKDPLTGETMAQMRGKSITQMAAFYDGDDDEWCVFAIEAEPYYPAVGSNDTRGWQVRFYDETAVHYLFARGDGHELSDWTYISYEPHPFRVPPVARCVNRLDNDGTTLGEIAPIIPLLQSIDQTKFDRLIVQRFGAWKIRWIAGLAKPSTEAAQRYQAMRLKVQDILIAEKETTKFGTLDATDLAGFISAHDADLRVLSAVTQTPPHHLLGLSANLQAEALAAAEAGLMRKSGDFRTGAGEFHEQMARLVAIADGHPEEARLPTVQVRWRDTESRSLTQAADALFKVAQGLHVPVEMLWERLPGWTDSDSLRAKALIESGDSIDRVLAALAELDAAAQNPDQGAPGGGGDAS